MRLDVLFFGFFILMLLAPFFKKSSTPTDSYAAWNKLPKGNFKVTFLRQSGGIHRECIVFGHQSEVEKVIHTAFNKAGIGDMYYIYQCSNGIKYTRRFYNGFGRNEGKKLGGAVVTFLGNN